MSNLLQLLRRSHFLDQIFNYIARGTNCFPKPELLILLYYLKVYETDK